MAQWLFDYYEILEHMDYLEQELGESKRELKRWVDGDLQGVKLTAESRSSGLEKNIKFLEDELVHQQEKLAGLLYIVKGFEDAESQVIFKKYVERKTLERAAEELDYSFGHVKRVHAKVAKRIRVYEAELFD